jgi:hypothetical protein
MRMLILSPVVEGTRKPRLYKIFNAGHAHFLMRCIQATDSFVIRCSDVEEVADPPRWSLVVEFLSTEYEFSYTNRDIVQRVYTEEEPKTNTRIIILACAPNIHQPITRALDSTHLYDELTLRTHCFFIDKTNNSAAIMKKWWIRTRRAWRREILGVASGEAIYIYAKRKHFALNADCMRLIIDLAFPPH